LSLFLPVEVDFGGSHHEMAVVRDGEGGRRKECGWWGTRP
jgi:hypothetical protein